MKYGINVNLVIICDEEDNYADDKSIYENDVQEVLRNFTHSGAVIAGRKTYNKLYNSSLGSRIQVILTKTLNQKSEKKSHVYLPNTNGFSTVVLADSIEKSHAFVRRLFWDGKNYNKRDVFILGGRSVFNQFVDSDLVDNIYLVQFYDNFDKNFGSIDFDREWKTVDVMFNDKYDIIKLEKRDHPLTEFDDPCE